MRRALFEARRADSQARLLLEAALPEPRSKYVPRLDVPKAQRRALKRMMEQYGQR